MEQKKNELEELKKENSDKIKRRNIKEAIEIAIIIYELFRIFSDFFTS